MTSLQIDDKTGEEMVRVMEDAMNNHKFCIPNQRHTGGLNSRIDIWRGSKGKVEGQMKGPHQNLDGKYFNILGKERAHVRSFILLSIHFGP